MENIEEKKVKEGLKMLENSTRSPEKRLDLAIYDQLSSWLRSPQSRKNPPQKFIETMENLFYNHEVAGYFAGIVSVQEELGDQAVQQEFADLPPAIEEGIKFFIKKAAVSDFEKIEILEKVALWSSKVARLLSHDLYSKLNLSFSLALEEGLSKRQWVQVTGIDQILSSQGINTTSKSGRWYIENIYRTNKQTAYAAGRWESIQQNNKNIAYLEYIATLDQRVTDICESLHGIRKPADDPIWSDYYPPNHFACRSETATISTLEAKARGLEQRGNTELIADFPPGNSSFRGNAGKDYGQLSEGMRERIDKYEISEDIQKREKELKERFQELRRSGKIKDYIY